MATTKIEKARYLVCLIILLPIHVYCLSNPKLILDARQDSPLTEIAFALVFVYGITISLGILMLAGAICRRSRQCGIDMGDRKVIRYCHQCGANQPAAVRRHKREITELALLIRKNRFSFRSTGVHALMDWLKSKDEMFDRDEFIRIIQTGETNGE